MNSKELVKKAIHYQGPERVPIGGLLVDWVRWRNDRRPEEVKEVEELEATIKNDVLYFPCDTPEVYREEDIRDGIIYDEWGVGWIYVSGVIMKNRYPLLDGWGKLDSMKVPDPGERKCYRWAKKLMSENKDKYFLPTVFFTVFERMWFIRGMENMLVDPLVDYDNFKRLRDKVMEFNHLNIDNWIKLGGVDGLFFSDDWGSQESLFIRPEDWRRFYKPCYKELFDKVKSAGIDVWMHLDGNITEIIPDLVEIGLDVYNPVQNQCVDHTWLRKEFGGHLAFNGGVDVQWTLPYGTPEQVKEEVHRVAATLGSPDGGYIMGTSHTIIPDIPMENMRALYDAVAGYQEVKK